MKLNHTNRYLNDTMKVKNNIIHHDNLSILYQIILIPLLLCRYYCLISRESSAFQCQFNLQII